MEFRPFTLEDAVEVQDDFEDLKDTEFKTGTSIVYTVHDVIISPFNEDDKLKFIDRYSQTKDCRESLNGYSGSEYDVLLVVYDVEDETKYTYTSIRTFAATKGIKYNFPVIAD